MAEVPVQIGRACLVVGRVANAFKERVLKKSIVFFWVFAALGFSQVNHSMVEKCLPAFYKLKEPTQESSVELEMMTDPAILSLFTTPSGKVGEFFERGPVPVELEWKFAGKTKDEIKDLFWHELTFSERMALLQSSAHRKRTSFFADRRIPHLVYAPEIPLHLRHRTQFLGRAYEQGPQLLSTQEFLKGPIEYMGPVNDPHGVELHFRTQRPAGEVSRSARTFQEMLGVPITHQHAYVVTPIPQKALEADPRLVSLQHADFFRRVNLAAEMISIVDRHHSITKNKRKMGDQEVLFFSWLEIEKLLEVRRYLEARGRHQGFELGDYVKMGWVGFRGHDKFDAPDLMGMEVRAIERDSDMADMERFLNAIQRTWATQDLGISKEKLQTWLNKTFEGSVDTALSQTWYHRDWVELFSKAKPAVAEQVQKWSSAERARMIMDFPEETKMLVHDWSKDPVLMDAPEKVKLIAEEQVNAIERLKTAWAAPNEIVRSFLIRSGLYERVLKSLVSETSLKSH